SPQAHLVTDLPVRAPETDDARAPDSSLDLTGSRWLLYCGPSTPLYPIAPPLLGGSCGFQEPGLAARSDSAPAAFSSPVADRWMAKATSQGKENTSKFPT